MMTDPRTIALYDSQADDYARLITPERPYPRLEAFIEALPAGGRVLDLGCGPGNWAARMRDRGLVVDALDASEGMAAVARARHGIDVTIGTFDDVTATDTYDGIWAHFSLLHARREDIGRHLRALARALRADGRLLLAMKLGDGEARDRKDRFYTYYREPELEGLLVSAGFRIDGRETGSDTGFDGSPHDFIIFHARRD